MLLQLAKAEHQKVKVEQALAVLCHAPVALTLDISSTTSVCSRFLFDQADPAGFDEAMPGVADVKAVLHEPPEGWSSLHGLADFLRRCKSSKPVKSR